MALQNLKSEFVRRGIKQYEVAEFLNMTSSNFNKKLSEAIPITREEMYAIRDRFCPECSIDDLFASDGDKPTKAELVNAREKYASSLARIDELPKHLQDIVGDLMQEDIAVLDAELERRGSVSDDRRTVA